MNDDMASEILIGDVHGCLLELQGLLAAVWDHVATGAHLIFIGDLIDKGPFQNEVVALARELERSHGVTTIMGNHEEVAVRAWRRGERPDLDPGHVAWFQSLPVALRLHDGSLAIHGGVLPDTPTEALIGASIANLAGKTRQAANKAMRARFVDPITGKMVNLADYNPAFHPPWSSLYLGEHGTVHHGHDHEARDTEWTRALDGGCVYGGVLRAVLRYPGGREERVEVPALRAYHPGYPRLAP